ncbi:MAG: TerC family protein [Alphaproteobacteria bacterium]|nr:TerC family protein [Alphaproteobacteria bacterium]
MLALLTDPEVWISLLTLTALEIVLGIDNVIFLSVVSSRLPPAQQPRTRHIGLALALAMRIVLLASISWIVGLTEPLLSLGEHVVSWRDIILLAGGMFLLAKGTMEIHHSVEGGGEHSGARRASFAAVITQIVLLDVVFSVDSIITAVGLVDELVIMITAVVIAMGVMVVAAGPVSAFVNEHPTVKMLALSFLLLIGVALIADGLHFHVPRGYLYFAIAFSALVEGLNLWARSRSRRAAARAASGAERRDR